MPKKWEGSKADKAADKKGAKKAGVSMKQWEGSKADEKMDKKMRGKKK
mgnify:CR=1 FL=1